ncbi:MAG TPA: DUF1080 domain-containing protein, partial [Chitinophaga sp.]
MRKILIFCSSLLLLHGVTNAGAPVKKGQWTPLFNGKDLKGWKQLGGTAKYGVENNEIVGTTVLQTPNSFLATEKDYGNFILELEFKLDKEFNSGIQF